MRLPSLTGQLNKSKLVGKANLEVDLPTGPDIKMKGGPKLSVPNVEADIRVVPLDGSLEARPSKVSKFAIKVLPDFKFKSNTKSTDLITLPTGLEVPEAELNLPKVEIHVPKASELALDIDVPDASAFQKPNLSMAIDMPEQDYSIAATAPDVKLDIESPSLSFSTPQVGTNTELKIKEPKISQPSVDLNLPTANLELDVKSPTLPDVAVGQDIPDLSVDMTKGSKSGFHIKFPKFGGSKSVKAEAPDVNIAAPEIDLSLPDASLEVDPKLKKDGVKGGFEFKMPKLSLRKKPEIAVEAKVPELDVDVKLPDASVELPTPAASVSVDVDVPSASVDLKKPKIGFSMPKFHMGKGQGEVKGSANVAIDVPSAKLDLADTSSSDDDDDHEGGKKNMKLKMPKIGFNKPEIDVNAPQVSAQVEIPSAQLNVGGGVGDIEIDKPDIKVKNKGFGFKMPKIGGSATVPDVNLDLDASVEHDVKLPNVEIKGQVSSESSDSDQDDAEEGGGKKKKKFNMKMPKFSLPKVEADVNAPGISAEAVNVNVPDVKPIEVEIGVPNLSADVLGMQSDSSEESDSEDDGKKKKGIKSLKIKTPKVQLGGDFTTPSLALSPIAVADVGSSDINIDAKVPSISLSTPSLGSELKMKEPKINQPSSSFDVNLPTANLELDVKSPTLPDIAVGQDIPNPEISLDVAKASKSGFHIKFPKFGGGKSAVKAEVPDVGVNIAAPELDVSLPEASLEVDPKLKKDGSKAGFEFKMPKLSLKKKPEVSLDAKMPSVNAQIPEVDVDVKVPDASIEVKPPVVSGPTADIDVPSVSVEVKKSKMGFSMPKFSMGKSHGEAKESVNLAVDVPNLQVDLPHPSTLSDDDDAEGGKKKIKFGKMPKFGLNKPQAQINVSAPEVSAEVEIPSPPQVSVGEIDVEKPDIKVKNKGFGFKLPKIGASATVPDVHLDVDASLEHDVKLPNVEIKADLSSESSDSDQDEDGEGGKKKKRFNIKMPKFSLPKVEADVNAPSISAEAVNVNVPDVKPIDANIEIGDPKLVVSVPKLSSHSDGSDSDDEKNIKGTGGLAIDVGGLDAGVTIDTENLNEGKKKSSKFGIKFPRLNVDKPRIKGELDDHSDSESSSSDEDDEDKTKSGKIKVTIPSVDLPRSDVGLQGALELPNTQFEVKQPKLDFETETGDDDNDDDETKKKSSKFGFSIKMPKFNMKKKTSNVDVELDKEASAHLNLDVTSGDTDDDRSSEDNHDKKKGKMSVKLPKFGMKKPEFDTDLSVNKSFDVQADVNIPKPEIDLPDFDIDVKDGDKETFSIKLPEVTVDKPKLDFDSSVEVEGLSKLSIDTGKIDFGNSPGGITIGGQIPPLSVPDASFSVKVPQAELPDIDFEVDHDDLDDEKKKSSKFFKMPKFHMGKHHGELKVDSGVKVNLPEKVDAEINLPTAKLDLDPNLNVDFHGKDDGDSDDDKKDKKKNRFGIKLPKFQMKHPNVDIKPEEVTISGKVPTIEASIEGSVEGGSISTDSASIDLDVPKIPDIHPVDLDVSIPDVKVEMPEKDGKKKGKFSFKSNFKMPKLHMGKGHAEVEVPTAEINLPKVEIDSSSRGETDDDFEGESEKKKGGAKFGVGLRMPKLRKPDVDVEVDADVSIPSVNFEAKGDDDSSDDEKDPEKKKSSSGFAFKMPKLNVGSTKAEVELPEVKPQISVKVPTIEEPNIEGNLQLQEGELSKKSPFIVKMPALSPIKPNIDMTESKGNSSSDDSSSDSDEEKSKKGFKLGFKMPQLSMGGKSDASSNLEAETSIKVNKPEVDLPSVDAEVSLPEVSTKKKSSFGAHFKMPTFSSKASVSAELPQVDIETPQIQIQADDDQDDNDKKSSKKMGIKMPKFQMRQRDADVTLPQVELKADDSSSDSSGDDSDKETKIEIKKPKFGIKLPEFNKPKLDVELPKKDVEVNLPEVKVQPQNISADLSADVNFPRADIEQPDISNVDIQVGNIDAEVAKVKAQLAQLQAEFDSQSAGKQKLKKEKDGSSSSSSSSDSENETKTKSSGLNFGLKLPKFKVGKEKPEVEAKVDVPTLSVTTKNIGDEITSLSSLEVEPVKLEGAPSLEKEKKKFSLGLKMPKFQSKGSAGVDIEAGTSSKDSSLTVETKPIKIKEPKLKLKKKKGDHRGQSSSSDSDSDEENHDEEEVRQLMGTEVKLPRVQVYKNVEYHDADKGHDSSSDEEDEVKDIKKNIGARFGVKLKKPKMFSSNKVEITGKNDSNSGGNSSIQPEWKLPRVDLRRASKSSDQELSVDVDLDIISEQQKLEQLSPSERAEAIRRDSKSSAGIRLHSPSYISLMPSPRSKKPSLETLDVESSPKLLSVTRLDPTPPIETSFTMQQPMYGNIELTTSVTGPQVSASQVPSSVIMASDAVKMKRGPPTPARRSIVDPNSSVFHIAQPVLTTDVTG